MTLHPVVAHRSCGDCRRWMYLDINGGFGPRDERGGRPKPRVGPTPCVRCPKIPPGAEPRPENAVELTPELAECVRFYRECKAVGHFPDDPLVRAAAVAVAAADDDVQQASSRRLTAALSRVLGGGR